MRLPDLIHHVGAAAPPLPSPCAPSSRSRVGVGDTVRLSPDSSLRAPYSSLICPLICRLIRLIITLSNLSLRLRIIISLRLRICLNLLMHLSIIIYDESSSSYY